MHCSCRINSALGAGLKKKKEKKKKLKTRKRDKRECGRCIQTML